MSENSDLIDSAFARLQAINLEIKSIDKHLWNEAETRLKVIDKILFEVLGWTKNETKVEDNAGSGYTDYTLKSNEINKVIVEAKKDSVEFGLDQRETGNGYKLNGAVFNQAAKAAILQAISYAALKGCELGCCTNGKEWIIFRANRMADGTEPLEGKGFIFNSPDEVEKNFQVFYDLLSKQSVEKLKFRGEFQRVEGTPLRDLSFLKPVKNTQYKKLLARGEYSTDFDALMASFFERLKGDQDPDMINTCFVVTKESELAEEKLLRIAEDLVEKVKKLDTSTGQELLELIESAKLQHRNRFILLVGNKGAGKSTFVDRFFHFVLPQDTANEIVLLRVDLSLNSGDEPSVVDWLNKKLLTECESVVFSENIDWNECVGKMFFDEYQRWSKGSMSNLYNSDKEQFKIEFGRYIEKIREQDRHDYIKRLINYITKSSHKIPCLVFDNTDHYTIKFQESVFQYARSIYESEFCVVILPITDKTSWQLSKQGALQSFESEVLHLPIPLPERVIERRIEYIFQKLTEGNEEERKQYFLNRGIRLRLDDISAFVSNLNRVFVESGETSKWIGGLANHDIRRLLELTKDTIASPHLKLDDLVKAHLAGNTNPIAEHRIKNAIIKKRYDIYPEGEHSFVQNIFSMITEPASSPLIGIRILQFLRDVGKNEDNTQIEFVKLCEITEYLTNIGVAGFITQKWAEKLLKTGLILNYDPTVLTLEDNSLVEISPSGIIHLNWGTIDLPYVQAMSLTTPLRDRSTHTVMSDSLADYKNKWGFSVISFIEYLISEDERYCTVPDHLSFEGQRKVIERLKWLTSRIQSQYSKRNTLVQ